MRIPVVACVSIAALSVPGAAWAAWSDAAPVVGTPLQAGTVPPPANFRCGGLGVLSVTFRWDAVPGATSYTLHHGSGGGLTQAVDGGTTTHTITTAISGGTAWVVANVHGFTSGASASRTYTVALASLCG